jgi:hypothetical protein
MTDARLLVDDIITGKRTFPKPTDIEKAIEGVSPYYVGDKATKEIVAYARAIFDPQRAERTAVPVMCLAKSGLGKTKFLEGLAFSMGADLIGANDLTGAGLGMVKEGYVVSANFSHVLAVDEIEKYEAKNIAEALLPIAEAERKMRVRNAIKFLRETGVLMIGVCLRNLGNLKEQGGNAQRRFHALEQLFRRCVLVKLEASQPEDQDEYTRLVIGQTKYIYGQHRHNTPEGNSKLEEYGKLFIASEVGKALLKRLNKTFTFEDEDWTFTHLQEATKGFFIGKDVEWGRKMQRNLILLAAGKALTRGEIVIKKEDLERVSGILIAHAKDLGYWEFPPSQTTL